MPVTTDQAERIVELTRKLRNLRNFTNGWPRNAARIVYMTAGGGTYEPVNVPGSTFDLDSSERKFLTKALDGIFEKREKEILQELTKLGWVETNKSKPKRRPQDEDDE